uniref:C2H2-type domain-containing protein n=1 Tax=viral metagenome TaxID=1070528 RepID=A0A6C0JD95_9ZZZZ
MDKKFHCALCNYFTNSNKDYSKHTTTKKHMNAVTNPDSILQIPSVEFFNCSLCNKQFKNRVTLWRHKKGCDVRPENQNIVNTIINVEPSSDLKITFDLVTKLIKENKELKDVLIEQSKAIIEISKKPNTTLIQNNTMNNTTNNNFNLNVFLNEQCKDAISITDFVNSLNLNVSDLEETGKLGYVLGISRIFINKLKELDVYERPLHCTDFKRETVYIKNQDSWEKDNQEKTKLKNIVNKIARKNLQQLPAWQAENPDYKTLNTPENNEYMKISLNSLGGYSLEEENKQFDKIMRNVLKEVIVDKNAITE